MAIGGIKFGPGIGKPGEQIIRPRPVVLHTIYGAHWAMMAGIQLDNKVLQAMGRCMVANLRRESKKYMAKIGWTGEDPMGGPPLWDSYSFRLVGSNVQIRSTFYGMEVLAHGKVPERRMTWLTQEAKKRHPADYALTPREKKFDKKLTSEDRMPLVVPIKTKSGNVEFRTAPLKLSNAWVHPGIAKFTFFETAIRKGRQSCMDIVTKKMQK